MAKTDPDPLKHLTPEAVQEIDRAVGEVMRAGFGEVKITIYKGVVRWVSPSPSREIQPPEQVRS